MKLVEKAKQKKHNIKRKPIEKAKKEHVLIVAQEIKFARLLSGNEKKTRDRVLKTLKKWLSSCFQKGYDFKEEDFARVWKGLFYAVWMSDKPLVQEELCENISSILDDFPNEHFKYALMMIKSGFKILATEWFGIDQHRMDKFMMLVRRYLRGSLRCLKRLDWNLEHCKMYTNMFLSADGILALKTPHYARNAMSMILHFIDCYLEELSKVSEGEIPPGSMVELVRPLCVHVCGGAALAGRSRRALNYLVRQSHLGLRYQDATAAWKRMGCPAGGPEALELVSDDEAEDQDSAPEPDDELDPSERPLDPRAGRVDVELNPLPVPAEELANLLRELLRTASSKAYKRGKICMERFSQLARQQYPLALSAADCSPASPARRTPRTHPGRAAQSLAKLEQQLVDSTDELALRGLSRKHRKRILARSRAGVNIVEELEKTRQIKAEKESRQEKNTQTKEGPWKVENNEPEKKKPKLHVDKKTKLNDDRLEKKRKINSTETGAASKKQKVEDKSRIEIKKEKGVSTGTQEAVIKVLTKNTKSKVLQKRIGSHSKILIKSKEERKADKETVVNGIKTEKPVKNAPKIIKHMEKHKGDKKVPQVNGIEKKKIVDSVKTKVSLQKDTNSKKISKDRSAKPTLLVNKVKNFQRSIKSETERKMSMSTPKKVKFVLKNNCMQGAVDYYKSVKQSPSIPYNPSKKPSKTNLKPSTPSPINPFFKKKLKLK